MAGPTRASMDRLTVNLDAWLAKSMEAARLKFIDVCLEAAEGVIERTPVDTGFARAMWSVSIGTPPAMKPLRPKEDWKTLQAAAAGAQAMAQIEAPVFGAKLGQTVWVYNPVVYAPRLEDGHSKQAPLGMVKVTLALLKAKYA